MTDVMFNVAKTRIAKALLDMDGTSVRALLLSVPKTVTTGSHTLPQGTINVTSTTGFPSSGSIAIGPQPGTRVAYTGVTGTSFTGCTGGTGTFAAGADVLGIVPAAAFDPDVATLAALLAISGVTEVGSSRVTPGSLTVTQDDANDRVNIDTADLSYAALTANVGALVFYDEGGGADATRYPISIHDTGFPILANNNTLNIAIADFLRLT